MKINLICVGKLKEKYLTGACDEYIKRLSAYCDLEITELKECALPELSGILENEGVAILKSAADNKKSYNIALCVEGESISSEKFAEKTAKLAVDGVSEITFIIGGSYGLSDSVKNFADFKFSMSKMTFPHQLARVMLLEQLYRSFQISNNGKYHK